MLVALGIPDKMPKESIKVYENIHFSVYSSAMDINTVENLNELKGI
jgi:hypothetical protein